MKTKIVTAIVSQYISAIQKLQASSYNCDETDRETIIGSLHLGFLAECKLSGRVKYPGFSSYCFRIRDEDGIYSNLAPVRQLLLEGVRFLNRRDTLEKFQFVFSDRGDVLYSQELVIGAGDFSGHTAFSSVSGARRSLSSLLLSHHIWYVHSIGDLVSEKS